MSTISHARCWGPRTSKWRCWTFRPCRLTAAESAPRLTALTGGVSSDIWKIETGDRVFVVKRALGRLRVAQEWTAPVSRNASEVAWIRTAGSVVPDAVPRVLADDPVVGA